MKSRGCFIALMLVLIIPCSGCVMSIRAPVEEGPESIELGICESVVIGGHELLVKDINIFGTSALLSIDGISIMAKDLGKVTLPPMIEGIELEIVAFSMDDGVYTIEIVYREV